MPDYDPDDVNRTADWVAFVLALSVVLTLCAVVAILGTML